MPNKREALKRIIRELHAGLSAEEARRRVQAEVGEISTDELIQIEQSLIDEGLPAEEVARFCNVHVLMVQNALRASAAKGSGGSHPLDLLAEENGAIRAIVGKLRGSLEPSGTLRRQALSDGLDRLQGLERHYAMKENILFPLLERHGFPGPTKVMWQKHDEIRGLLKAAGSAVQKPGSGDSEKQTRLAVEALLDEVEGMVQKDELGWAYLDRGKRPQAAAAAGTTRAAPEAGAIVLPSGRFSVDELVSMLNTLPLDITFVDAQDRVRYYSEGKERIFVRTRSVIGRQVQNCHPPKSLAAVQRILDDFRSGKADHRDFWIRYQGRMVYIRYFAVRDAQGKYLGCLEATQDITDIQKLEGEKRLED
jgi:hypothetical protein